MAEFVYILCALTAIACATLLLRGYRAHRTKLLFWSCLCFTGLAINNALLLLDLYMMPSADLVVMRAAVSLTAIVVLLYGLIWDAD